MSVKPIFTLLFLFWVLGATAQVNFSYNGNPCINTVLQFTNLSNAGVTNLEWEFGDGGTSVATNPTHAYAAAGTYTVVLSGLFNGVTVSKQNTIVIGPNPTVNFSDSTLYYSSFTHIFTSQSGGGTGQLRYFWNFGDNQSLGTQSNMVSHKYTEAGSYAVKLVVSDANECADSVTNAITVDDVFKVPNVFTPNGDNVNDQFIVTTNGETLFSIDIYSRWGVLVFTRTDRQQLVWDGRMPDGSVVSPGTYYYVITPLDNSAAYEPLNGFITVFY